MGSPEGVHYTSAAIMYFCELDFYHVIPDTDIRRSTRGGQPSKTVSRFMATRWLMTNASRGYRAESRNIWHDEWWWELSTYRFLLSPMTEEIQSVRNVEALLVLTIPIVQRGPHRVFDDLVSLGFPIVVVNEWAEINNETQRVWQLGLTPRLASFRARCLTTTAFWLMITGDL